ncbi:aldo/keto reductase [Bradyrhizobium sp. ARR65]|uniref:aldo/keto reductase n=1 Tax=Bradyrhizobium sp. ARR65 TaxID=1040989 RepID=UPI000A0520E6|nr:aldo/keto reductase [Bradyrhizobium sp. ARR65]
MREVYSKALGRNVSAIGFGCASLGSRISPSGGRRAVDMALEYGVTWFDVAPSYGDGQAEELLGSCLRGRRDRVVICTKVGIPRPRLSVSKRLLRPLARTVVSRVPAARSVVRRAHMLPARTTIHPDLIESSLLQSLRSLRTDHVDVLALHEPTPEEAADKRIFDVLERLLDRGLIRAICVAGPPDSIIASVSRRLHVDYAQFRDAPHNGVAIRLRSELPRDYRPQFVTHGVFGTENSNEISMLSSRASETLKFWLQEYDPHATELVADLLLHFAFSNNPDGVVITSMFNAWHIDHNCSLAAKRPTADLAAKVYSLLKNRYI